MANRKENDIDMASVTVKLLEIITCNEGIYK